nr:MAG TPA: hypothetical protein [Caudoviricetes sp.]
MLMINALICVGPSGGEAFHGAGASRKKASFCIFIHHHHLFNALNLNEFYF